MDPQLMSSTIVQFWDREIKIESGFLLSIPCHRQMLLFVTFILIASCVPVMRPIISIDCKYFRVGDSLFKDKSGVTSSSLINSQHRGEIG